MELQLKQIKRNPDQPRRSFDPAALGELASSIKANGLIQPIVVQPHGDGDRYIVVDGERRWRASIVAALAGSDDDLISKYLETVSCGLMIDQVVHELNGQTIPVVIADQAEGTDLLIRSTVANLQRADLSVIELADAYQTMADAGMTDAEIATAVGKGRSSVANARRLAGLPADMRRAVAAGTISQRTAQAYLPLLDIKPHLLGDAWPPLKKDPNFGSWEVPTPGALRKRLCNPDKYGKKPLTSDNVRHLADEIKAACTPDPCDVCSGDMRRLGKSPFDGKWVCSDCQMKLREKQEHPRWCKHCGQERIFDGIQVTHNDLIYTCEGCGRSEPISLWRYSPKKEPEYRPLDLGEPAQESPPPKQLVTYYKCKNFYCNHNNSFPVPSDTLVCKHCSAQHINDNAGYRLAPGEDERLRELSHKNDVGAPTPEPAPEPPAVAPWEAQPNYAVYPCHNCGEKKIRIDAENNRVECEACGEDWESISAYHAEREYYEDKAKTQPEPDPNGWQPIETAPEHEFCLIYRDQAIGSDIMMAYRDQNDWRWQGGEITEPPTHWMPLPAPPQTQKRPLPRKEI